MSLLRVFHKGAIRLRCYARNMTASALSSRIKVKVRQGVVIGREDVLPNGNIYHSFLGIPYAVPAVKDLRFKAPVPLDIFSTPEIECTKDGSASYQKDPLIGRITGSEDCLNLNVYSPKANQSAPLPVMVFLHGGGFMFGSGSSDYHTPLYLMQEGVLVVTLNYRLGVLGFLSVPEANVPGNFGLKDQRLALRWIRENIAAFGGDPDNITLFGESAGGASAHLHLLSQNSKNLFHKVIMQSGLANQPWVFQKEPAGKAQQIAQSAGCQSKNPVEIVKFLKEQNDISSFVNNIIRTLTPDEVERGLPLPMKPVVEKPSPESVVIEEPLIAMNRENTISIPIMVGYNSGDGIVMTANSLRNIETYDKDYRKLIPCDIKLGWNDPKSYEAGRRIKDFLFKNKTIQESLNTLAEFFTDINFLNDVYVLSELHSRKQPNSPLYVYRFDYVGGLNMYKNILNMDCKGACHADELSYIFQSKMFPEPWPETDKRIVLIMARLWANFAKYGNPTPNKSDSLINCNWDPVKKIKKHESLNLNAYIIDKDLRMVENPNIERNLFWRDIYKLYSEQARPKL